MRQTTRLPSHLSLVSALWTLYWIAILVHRVTMCTVYILFSPDLLRGSSVVYFNTVPSTDNIVKCHVESHAGLYAGRRQRVTPK